MSTPAAGLRFPDDVVIARCCVECSHFDDFRHEYPGKFRFRQVFHDAYDFQLKTGRPCLLYPCGLIYDNEFRFVEGKKACSVYPGAHCKK